MKKYLNRPVAVAVVIAIVGLLAYTFKNSPPLEHGAPNPVQRRPRVAVLPFGMQPTDSKQQAELDKIDEKYYEALWRARDEYMNVLTPQQRQAQREASKTAFQEGKRGKELQDAANKLAGISEELQAKLKKARAELDSLTTLMRGEVEAIMTEGQLKQLEEKNKIAAMKNQVQRAQAPATSQTAAKVPKISPNKKSKK